MQTRNFHRLPRRSATVAALAALASCPAFADEPNPYYIGASVGLTHDSNVNRLSDDFTGPGSDSRSDTYVTTSLLGGFDQSYGRQRFYGAANIGYNKYDKNSYLSNTSYGVNGGWDWATVYNLSGSLLASANQSLAQLNGNTTGATTTRNLVRSDQVGGNVNWGGTGILQVQGAYTHSRVRYTNDNQSSPNSSADTASLGLFHIVGPTLTVGVAYRLTRTETPASLSSATSRGRNIDLTADWRYSAQTNVNSRLSFTRQTNAGGGDQAFSGLTGSVSANYAPTGKLAFNVSYNRDAGTNGGFFNVPITSTTTGPNGTQVTTTTPGQDVLTQNSQVANSLTVGGRYAATAKIGVNASYLYRSATISNTGAADYKDKLQIASLGATWNIYRAWSLACNLSHEKRDADSQPVPYVYSANVVGCSAQVTLR